MGNNLAGMMKVMRMANRRGKSNLDLNSLFSSTIENQKALKYPIQNLTYWNKGKTTKMDSRTMIPVCYFDSYNEDGYQKKVFNKDSCSYFQPVFTDMGMCHVFNPSSVMDMIKPSYFTESFFNAYEDDLNPNETIHKGIQSGHSFNFYLMGNHRTRITSHGKGPFGKDLQPSKFLFSLSNKDEYFNMKSSSKIMPAGYKITWNVQAMEIQPSEDLKNLDIDSRRCRFPDETEDLEIFNFYTKPACEFEYRMKKAREKCKCTPWNIPAPFQERYPICDIYGNFCFETIKNQYQVNIGECLPGCHQLKFTSSEVREKLDADYICTKGDKMSGVGGIVKRVIEYNGYELFHKIKTLKQWTENDQSNDERYNATQAEIELCKEIVNNDVMEVNVMFERQEYILTRTSERVTFPDKLGAFGINLCQC